MTRENILSIIKGEDIDVTTLNKNNSYIITMEVGKMPKEKLMQLGHRVAELLRNAQIEHFILVPTQDNIPTFKFYEFKDGQVSEIDENKNN